MSEPIARRLTGISAKATWDRLSRLMSQLNLTQSYPGPREHAGKAYDHYREPFRRSFEDAGESFDRAIERMTEWLQGRS